MPLILVSRDPIIIGDEMLEILSAELPHIIAQHLSGTEVTLSSEDIEVRFGDFGPFDVKSRGLEIVIFANDHPQRRESLKERTGWIVDDIRKILKDIGSRNFWVWVRLAKGEFVDVP